MIRRGMQLVGTTTALVILSATGASAHECYNASRSDKGNEMAGSKSQAWFTLVVSDAIQGDADAGLITQEQAASISPPPILKR